MQLLWTERAVGELADLHFSVSASSMDAPYRQLAIVLNAARSLEDLPERGRPGRRRGTRELVVSGTPYLLAYRIRKSSIEILAVLHGARRWPRSFD